MGTFSQAFRQFRTQTVPERAGKIFRKIALTAYGKIQRLTPVDTGQLRKSWTVSINALPMDYQGDQSALTQAQFGDTLFIATDKPYAKQLEYGLYPSPSKTGKTINGYSIQAPRGMVRITLDEMQDYVKRMNLR